MKIYQLIEDKGADYEDHSAWDLLITENPHIIVDKCIEVMEDEDFTTTGWKSNYSYIVNTWENGKSKTLWYITPSNKIESFNFLDILGK